MKLFSRYALVFTCLFWLVSYVYFLVWFLTTADDEVQCDNRAARQILERECTLYRAGIVSGSLCEELCNHNMTITACDMSHVTTVVLHTTLGGRMAVLKTKRMRSAENLTYLFNDDNMTLDDVRKVFSESAMDHIVSQMEDESIRSKMSPSQLLQLFWDEDVKKMQLKDMRSLWQLLQQGEYWILKYYHYIRQFSRVFGTCGKFYAVERAEYDLMPVEFRFTITPKNISWRNRLKLAFDLLNLMEELDKLSLNHCDVQESNFGVTSDFRIIAIDVDLIFNSKVLQTLVAQPSCTSNKDCDFFDCVSECDVALGKCSKRVVTNNIQVLCKDIFKGGWHSSGLLTNPPAAAAKQLDSLLKSCASEEYLPWSLSYQKIILQELKSFIVKEYNKPDQDPG